MFKEQAERSSHASHLLLLPPDRAAAYGEYNRTIELFTRTLGSWTRPQACRGEHQLFRIDTCTINPVAPLMTEGGCRPS